MDKKNVADIYRLTPVQEGMLFHTLQDPQSCMYVEQFGQRVPKVEAKGFSDLWQLIFKHHTILRTGFFFKGLDKPVQVVFKTLPIPVEHLDFSSMTPEDAEHALQQFKSHDENKPFDLNKPPLMRLALIQLPNQESYFLWTYHHILMDGWSAFSVIDEFFGMAYALENGEDIQDLEKLDSQRAPEYKTYIRWLDQQDSEAEKQYWRDYLQGFSAPTRLNFGLGAGNSPELREHIILSESVGLANADKLRVFSRQNQLTLNTLLQAAWGYLLSVSAGEDDVLFGATCSGRPVSLSGANKMVGLFINTLPCRVKIRPEQTIKSWLKALQAQQVSSREYEHSSLTDIDSVCDVPNNCSLFDSILAVESFPASSNVALPEVNVSQRTNYPLTLVVEPEGKITIKAMFFSDNFSRTQIQAVLSRFVYVLTQIPDKADLGIGNLSLLTPEDGERQNKSSSNNKLSYSTLTLDALISARSEQYADKQALVSDKGSLTYAQLENRANGLANNLLANGIVVGEKIAVLMHPSPDLVVALLAVVKVGGTYVPIDPGLPEPRVLAMLGDLNIDCCLTSSEVIQEYDKAFASIDALESYSYLDNFMCLDSMVWEALDCTPVTGRSTQKQVLYVIHTSGSTGTPKATAVNQEGFISFVQWWNDAFRLTEYDSNLLISKISFDLSQKNIWSPLLAGGCINLYTEKTFNPFAVKKLIHENTISWLNCTPSVAYSLLESCESNYQSLASLRYLHLGGETIDGRKFSEWLRDPTCQCRIVNNYGPSEATDICATHVFTESALQSEREQLPVGKTIPNVTLYVVDRFGNVLPWGVQGEVVVGGVSVGIGYLNNVKQTAEKFIPDPYQSSKRCYYTGDLGYVNERGELVVTGRRDNQIKLRGFRIELGEIESHLLSIKGVEQAVVKLAKNDNLEENELWAYLVLDRENMEALEPGVIHLQLGKILPNYMLPTAYRQLDQLPLNANGKVDKKQLPELDSRDRPVTCQRVAPRTETERQLKGLWQDLLVVDDLGVDDDFFSVGGHSLLLTRLFSRIPKVFNVQIKLSELFDNPTIAVQAKHIDHALQRDGAQIDLPAISKSPEEKYIPLSFAQQRMWFLYQYQPDNPAYHISNRIELERAYSEIEVIAALQALTQRHDILRTSFKKHASEYQREGQIHEAYQYVADNVDIPLIVEDLRFFSEEASRKKLCDIATRAILTAYDLENGPLTHCTLVYCRDKAYLFFSQHHIITDGWSTDILLNELKEYLAKPGTVLSDLTLNYRDYTVWQRKLFEDDKLHQQFDFWKKQLASSCPTIGLPYDFVRPERMDHEGGIVRQSLSHDLSTRLRSIAQDQRLSLYNVVLAAFNVLIYRLSGQKDFNIGTPVAGRSQNELEPIAGLFVNTVVLRQQIDANLDSDGGARRGFLDYLNDVAAIARAAFDNQDIPFEQLVECICDDRNPSLNPLFQVMFSWRDSYEDISSIDTENWISRFDLQLTASNGEHGNIGLVWEYRQAVFKKESVENFSRYLENILLEISDNIEVDIEKIKLIDRHEQVAEWQKWLPAEAKYARDKSLGEVFSKLAENNPDRIAVECEQEKLSYGELETKSNQLANYLIHNGVGINQGVGVGLPRGIQQITAILAIIKAGGFYVALDPEYPISRLDYMVENSDIKLLLTNIATTDLFTLSSSEGRHIKKISLDHSKVIKEIQQQSEDLNKAYSVILPDRLAYISYTSGTTGQPKGVCVPQRAVMRLVQNSNFCDLNAQTVMLQIAPVAFDASTLEIWGPLINGGRIVCYPDSIIDIPKMQSLIRRAEVNTGFFSAGLFREWMSQLDGPTGMHHLLTGGDVVSPQAVQRLYALDQSVQCINGYGPTENTTFSSFHFISRDLDGCRPIPIGKSITNSTTVVLDKEKNICPVGVCGELYVGGDGLATGYHKLEEQTRNKFVEIVVPGVGKQRLYRTGDLVRRQSDGELEYLGREDKQVKIRGFRIELSEVQAAISEHPMVKDCVISVHESERGKQLVAYLVSLSGMTIHTDELRRFAKRKLPSFMAPAVYVALKNLPLTSNGKVDHQRLPEPSMETNRGEIKYPETASQKLIAKIWSNVLDTSHFGIDDDFFALGGHSLLAARVTAAIKDETDVYVGLQDFFSLSTIRELGQLLDQQFAARAVEEEEETGCL